MKRAFGPKIITIASGKGGAGKSTFALSLAIALAQFGIRPLVLDADFGLANIDVLLGVQTKANLSHFFRGEKTLQEIIQIGYDGVRFISGGSGAQALLNLPPERVARLMQSLAELDSPIDYVLCDVGAGITENILQMIAGSAETFIVTTPEPTSIVDAFALVKTAFRRGGAFPMRVVMNRADTRREGERVFDGFRDMIARGTGMNVECLGILPTDAEVRQSIKTQTPVMVGAADSKYGREIRAIARVLLELPPELEKGGLKKWFSKG